MKQDMSSMSFIDKEVEANQTFISEEEKNQLDMKRLTDHNDDYDEILYSSKRRFVRRDGEIIMSVPRPTDEIIEFWKSGHKVEGLNQFCRP